MLLNKPSLYTIKCKSVNGIVLFINELEFVRRIKGNELTIKVIEKVCEEKAKSVAKILLTSNSYLN
jgi:hypothetical protein